jgi:hypothetical protein
VGPFGDNDYLALIDLTLRIHDLTGSGTMLVGALGMLTIGGIGSGVYRRLARRRATAGPPSGPYSGAPS